MSIDRGAKAVSAPSNRTSASGGLAALARPLSAATAGVSVTSMAPAPLFDDRYLGEHRGTAYRRLPPGIAARGAVCVAIPGHREWSSIRLLHALTEQGMILKQSRGRRDTRDGR
jgi:hypothetical protein